jgi:hypothetical protein
MRHRIQIIGLVVIVVLQAVFNLWMTAHQNARLTASTKAHNAQLVEFTERFNAQLAEQNERFKAQLSAQAAELQKK